MYGLIVVMSTMILLIKFWPVEEKSIERIDEIVYHDEVLIDEIEITRQQSAPPPPPRPQVPQPVPDDEIIEDDLELEEELNLVDFPDLPEDFGTGLDGDEQVIVSNPQLPPSVVRIVEPSVPDLPNELRGRIEMVVNFLVNRDGTVEEASIVEIRKYDENRDDYEVLPFIQYGLMDATLKAALNWRFRAARHDGIGVSTFTTATFNY
jgi:hypothetical protein